MKTQRDLITINGAHGEGGPALFRAALAMAALTQQPLKIHHIRGGTRKTGIQPEDLALIHALESSCAAELEGAEISSDELVFRPQRVPQPVSLKLDHQLFERGNHPGNALILTHALLPVLARAGGVSRITAIGETYNPHALTYDSFENVTLAAHRKQGIYAYTRMLLPGFGYAAKGEIATEIEPSQPNGLQWEHRGELVEIGARIVTSELPPTVCERGAAHLERLGHENGLTIDVDPILLESRTPGAFVTIWAQFENGIGCGTAMGARGVRMESVVNQAFENFMAWFRSERAVDPFLADQLLLPAILAKEPTVISTNRVTSRLITLGWVAKQFLPIHVTILGMEGEPGLVKVQPVS